MTGNSTPAEKLRAVFLAALMIGSVFAAGIAFSGTAAAAVTNVTATNAQEVGNGVTVTVDLDTTNGETVVINNTIDGNVVQSMTVTDDGAMDDNQSPGTIQVTLNAAKADSGSSQVEVTSEADGSTGSDTYTTTNYRVIVDQQNVTHGDTVTISANVYEFWADGGDTTSLEDDITLDYSLVYENVDGDSVVEAADEVLAESDTNSGQFSVRRTFDNVDDTFRNDYPVDDSSVNTPQYEVYVDQADPANDDGSTTSTVGGYSADTPSAENNAGGDGIPVRLDVTANPQSDLVYDASVDVSGDVQNVSQGLSQYAIKLNTPDGTVAKTTDTAQDGSYVYTAVFNDAGEWSFGTDEGGFIEYGTLQVDSVEANVDIFVDGGNLANFPESYEVTVDDPNGDDLEVTTAGTNEGYVAIVGEFAESSVSPTGDGSAQAFDEATVDGFSDITITQGNAIRAADTDGDGDINQIHIETNATGGIAVDATPVGSSVTAQLQNDQDLTDLDNIVEGVEITDDAGDTPEFPDYTGSASANVENADPVNVIGAAVEDPHDVQLTSVNDGGGLDGYTNIFNDPGPAIVEVLPLASDTDDDDAIADQRFMDGERLGFDGNRDLAGMTVYRVSFDLRDQSNNPIVPGTADGQFSKIEIVGAGINGTISVDDAVADYTSGPDNNLEITGQNIIDAEYDADSPQYEFLIRPTSTDTDDEQIEHDISVNGEDAVPLPLDASGLDIEEFQVNGEEVTAVTPLTTLNVTSVIEAPYDNNVPVNNGRVRLTQTGTSLDAETDARTANVNDGEYTFNNVDIGPRGIDNDADGIGEEISELFFTAYQYNDTSGDQALERDEVDRAAVESLDLELDDSLQIDYDAENTSVYSGDDDGTFTLTQGVEYNQIAFELTDSEGNPVDLTDGIDGVEVGLNELTYAGDDRLIYFTTSNGGEVDVHFNTGASDPSAGYYVIGDLTQSVPGERDLDNDGTADDIDSLEEIGGLSPSDDGSFVFDSGGVADTSTTFTLNVETPDRSQATNASETGSLVAAPPMIQQEVVGVAGAEVPFSGDTFGTDNFNMNVSDIEDFTLGIERTYRVNATAMDALGTPLNGSMDDEVIVQFVDDEVIATDGDDPNPVDFQMVDTEGTDAATDKGLPEFEFRASSSGNNIYEYGLDPDSDVEVTNENGTFTYDIQVNEDATFSSFFDSDSQTYTPPFIVGKQVDFDSVESDTFEENTGDTTSYEGEGEGFITVGEAQRPVVEVYDVNGATLPTNPSADSDNKVLAQDVTNNLRVEAFPNDPNDFPMPSLDFGFPNDDPFAENVVGTTTELSDDVITGDFEEGQIGFLSVTPTGTGTGIIALVNAADGSTQADAGVDTVVDIAGEDIVFDVLRSNLQVDIGLSTSSVTAGDNVTVSLTARATGEDISDAGVSLVDPNGNVVSEATTDANGQVTFEVSENATGGTYTVETRPAGFQPNSVELGVTAASDDNPVVGDQPATNLDGDAELEDVNGDGTGDIFDAIELYNNRNSDAVQDNINLFDFDGDGDVDLFDAIELYNELSA